MSIAIPGLSFGRLTVMPSITRAKSIAIRLSTKRTNAPAVMCAETRIIPKAVRMDGRVDEGAALERQLAGKGYVGSNPTPSANPKPQLTV